MRSQNSLLLKKLFSPARKAGEAILQIQKHGKIDAAKKPDGTPITNADKVAHKILISEIKKIANDIPIISEEDFLQQKKLPSKYFLVDPLDGTKEFLQGSKNFTVNIALIENKSPVLGIIFAPLLGKMFAGLVGEGAVQATRNESFIINTKKILPPHALVSVNHGDEKTQQYLKRNKIKNITAIGSSIKFCMVANGQANLYVRFGEMRAWDIAAGDAIVRSAGGLVLNAKTNAPLEYESISVPPFLCGEKNLIKNLQN